MEDCVLSSLCRFENIVLLALKDPVLKVSSPSCDPPLCRIENIVRGQSLSHTSWKNCVEAAPRSIKKRSNYCCRRLWCSINTLTHEQGTFQNTHLMANILFVHSAVRLIDATRRIFSTTSPHECVALVSKHRIWRPNKLALHGEICVSVIPKRRIWRAAQH